MAKPSQRTLEISLFLLIALTTAVVYIPTFNLLLEKEAVDSFIYPITFRLVEHLPTWIFYQSVHGFIRPVFILSLFPDIWIYGTSAWGYRLTNLLLHLSCLVAMYVFGRVLFGRTLWLLLAVGIFALHPCLVGIVVITMNRQELLALFFLLMGLTAWGVYLKDPRKGWRYLWGAGLLFLLSLLSKEIAICIPLLVAALHFTIWKQGRTTRRLKEVLGPYLGLALLWGGYLGIRWLCFGGIGGYKGSAPMGVQAVKSFAGVVLAPLTLFGDEYLLTGGLTLKLVLALAIGSLVILLGLWPRRAGSLRWGTIFGFLFMILSSVALLTFNWMGLGMWHAYMPLAGFALGIAGLFREAEQRFSAWRLPLITAAVLIPIALLSATIVQINHQKDELRDETVEDPDYILRYVIQHPPEPGRTLQVWNRDWHFMMIFDTYPDLTHVRQEKYLSNYLTLILFSPTTRGDIVVGFRVWRPYEVSLNLKDEVYRLTYTNGSPALAPVDSATFWREVVANPRGGIREGDQSTRKKNPALKVMER